VEAGQLTANEDGIYKNDPKIAASYQEAGIDWTRPLGDPPRYGPVQRGREPHSERPSRGPPPPPLESTEYGDEKQGDRADQLNQGRGGAGRSVPLRPTADDVPSHDGLIAVLVDVASPPGLMMTCASPSRVITDLSCCQPSRADDVPGDYYHGTTRSHDGVLEVESG